MRFLYLCTSWIWVVSFTPLFPQNPLIGGCVDGRSILDGIERRKFFTLLGLRLLHLCHPAFIQSLYRLHYPSSTLCTLYRTNLMTNMQYFVIFALLQKITWHRMPKFCRNIFMELTSWLILTGDWERWVFLSVFLFTCSRPSKQRRKPLNTEPGTLQNML